MLPIQWKAVYIRMPEEQHNAFRSRCKETGVSMALIAEALVRAYVEGKVEVTVVASKCEVVS